LHDEQKELHDLHELPFEHGNHASSHADGYSAGKSASWDFLLHKCLAFGREQGVKVAVVVILWKIVDNHLLLLGLGLTFRLYPQGRPQKRAL
jgi:hypothetical protein